jgi:hypothetical protein
MRRALLLLAFALIGTGQAFPQSVVSDWLPSYAGDKRIYEHETRDDNSGIAHLEVHRWKTEETAVGSWPVPEGILVGRRVRIIEGSPPPDWVHSERERAYLIRGDCVYLSELDGDPHDHQLARAFRQDLLAGHLSADFCFPLVVGKAWGAPHWTEWRAPSDAKDWRVAAKEARDSPNPQKDDTFHITSASSYRGSGMTADIWFEKGVGIVREEEIHHGTIGEERTRLLRFKSASQR